MKSPKIFSNILFKNMNFFYAALINQILFYSVSPAQVILENPDMRLTLDAHGHAVSLIHKPTDQECLSSVEKIPAFAIAQDRPYDTEQMLALPVKRTVFYADTIYRSGNDLIVGFDQVRYTATIGVKITDDYIGFRLKKLDYDLKGFRKKRRTTIDEFTMLQLPVADRKNFGDWLNVMWDDDVAVCLLATDPYAKIDGIQRNGFHLMQAGGIPEVKIEGIGAALITTSTKNLLDHIDRIEKDYNLPEGVKSRRSEPYKWSYYETYEELSPDNVERHIQYAREGGFKCFMIYYPNFAKTMGHFPWKETYPDGMEDLKRVVKKIKEAGMMPGIHFHYNKAQINDAYVTPVPDNRLNLTRYFTLATPIGPDETTLTVLEDPSGCVMEDNRRILKIGSELISYENYTTTPPYRFTGCKRGILNTKTSAHSGGTIFGLLDVDTWPIFVRFNQRTDLQQEVAGKLGEIYREAGFEFAYFDGAEDVPPPYWYNVSHAQLVTYDSLNPRPVFSEAACKSHFSWHMITRGNAFDPFKPEDIKNATRAHPAMEIQLISKDFSAINFGWIKFVGPGKSTIGIQPDMLEFVTSKAAAWDCPISFFGTIAEFEKSPRTPDNLEVLKRWEDIRINNKLTQEQKEELKDLQQEFTLLNNDSGGYDLIRCKHMKDAAASNKNLRAFILTYKGDVWVKYWHATGEGVLSIPVKKNQIVLYKIPGQKVKGVTGGKSSVDVPAGPVRFLKFKMPEDEVIRALQKAELTTSMH